MSKRFNNGSHYENHQRADELQEGAAHAHLVREQHGKQDHLTGARALTASRSSTPPQPHEHGHHAGHGIVAFGHKEIAALAYEFWQAQRLSGRIGRTKIGSSP